MPPWNRHNYPTEYWIPRSNDTKVEHVKLHNLLSKKEIYGFLFLIHLIFDDNLNKYLRLNSSKMNRLILVSRMINTIHYVILNLIHLVRTYLFSAVFALLLFFSSKYCLLWLCYFLCVNDLSQREWYWVSIKLFQPHFNIKSHFNPYIKETFVHASTFSASYLPFPVFSIFHYTNSLGLLDISRTQSKYHNVASCAHVNSCFVLKTWTVIKHN